MIITLKHTRCFSTCARSFSVKAL